MIWYIYIYILDHTHNIIKDQCKREAAERDAVGGAEGGAEGVRWDPYTGTFQN